MTDLVITLSDWTTVRISAAAVAQDKDDKLRGEMQKLYAGRRRRAATGSPKEG